MPAVTLVVGEETPGMAVVLVLHQDADTARLTGLVAHVLLPDDRQEQRTSRVHDGDVREQPAPIVGLQRLDHAQEERVLRDGTHGVVRDTCGCGTTDPGWVGQKGIQAAVAAL